MSGGAPSELHEWRRAELDTMLMLAGYTRLVRLAPGLIPDVSRGSIGNMRLAVGDAKATESPLNASTRIRLVHYVRAGHRFVARGWRYSLLLAVSAQDADRWAHTAGEVWNIGGMRAAVPRVEQIHSELAVVTIEV